MIKKIVSAGLVSQTFWFIEMRKMLELVKSGKSKGEIKTACIEDNIFGAPNERRAKEIYSGVWNRVQNLDDKIIDIFFNSDLPTQKLINLIAIIRGNRTYFDFINEVYREKIILGIPNIEDMDIKAFFRNKSVQDELVAKWTDVTKRRLGSAYINFMVDANLLSNINGKMNITPPIIDMDLERYLENSGDRALIKALTGER